MLALDLHPSKPTLTQFAAIAVFGFATIAGFAHWKWGAPSWLAASLLGLGVWLGLEAMLGFVERGLTRPIFVIMTLVAMPIGFVVTHLLLGLIFFVLFTPVAIFFRLTGRDPLQRAWNQETKSYWHTRARQRSPASYLRLY